VSTATLPIEAPPWLEARRARAVAAWTLEGDEVVLVPAGTPPLIPGRDFPYPFMVHPEHRYLADVEVADAVLALDAASGDWVLFTPRPDVDDRIWHADVPALGRPLSELDAWLADRSGRPVVTIADDADPDQHHSRILTDLRLLKDDEEISRLRRAADATAHGFEVLLAAARPGRTEKAVAAEVDAAFVVAGGDRTAYHSIVAAGRNGAVLHFAPGDTELQAGDLLLVDAGAESGGYASDCTRTFVVGAEPSPVQRRLWEIVHAAQAEGVTLCRPGQEYREVHLQVARSMAAGLVEIGLLRGVPDQLVADGTMALFFPHGVGHLLGLAVHDPGGYAPGRERSPAAGLRFLRADRPLQEHMVVTIEPGIYFIEVLLADPAVRATHGDAVDWAMAEELLALGGIRIEDTVLVTADGGDPLTGHIPKVISNVSAIA
jgi:Xaa-Pro aminopeptidase